MAKEANRRRKTTRQYEIVFVPVGEVGATRTFRASKLKLILLGILAFAASVAVTLAVLIYTPVAMYVPIPNPALEERYGRQIVTLQERLNNLAEDVLILRDYNVQLRKALGESGVPDTSSRRTQSQIAQADERVTQRDEVPVQEPTPGSQSDLVMDEGVEPSGSPSAVSSPSAEGLHPSFPLTMPADGVATQGFDPANGHYGIDIASRKGNPIYAASDGIVVFSGWTYDDGNMLMISHGRGYLTVYKHAQALLKPSHASVKRGEPIALIGNTGMTSLGPHLHFEVWKDGIPQDPADFVLASSRIQ